MTKRFLDHLNQLRGGREVVESGRRDDDVRSVLVEFALASFPFEKFDVLGVLQPLAVLFNSNPTATY